MGKKSNTGPAGQAVQGLLKGMGGAFLGAIAAKIAVDLYEQLKRRYFSAPRGDEDGDAA